DGGVELDRPAGGRHRRDEHHAGVGDRADLRNRHPQSHRRAPLRRADSVPHRSRGADGPGRNRRDRFRLDSFADQPSDIPVDSGERAALGGGGGGGGVGGGGGGFGRE